MPKKNRDGRRDSALDSLFTIVGFCVVMLFLLNTVFGFADFDIRWREAGTFSHRGPFDGFVRDKNGTMYHVKEHNHFNGTLDRVDVSVVDDNEVRALVLSADERSAAAYRTVSFIVAMIFITVIGLLLTSGLIVLFVTCFSRRLGQPYHSRYDPELMERIFIHPRPNQLAPEYEPFPGQAKANIAVQPILTDGH